MPREILTWSRFPVLGAALGGTIANGYFNSQIAEEEAKQLRIESEAITGPEKSTENQLKVLGSEHKSIKANEELDRKRFSDELSISEERVKGAVDFAKEGVKPLSDDKDFLAALGKTVEAQKEINEPKKEENPKKEGRLRRAVRTVAKNANFSPTQGRHARGQGETGKKDTDTPGMGE